MVNCHVSSFVKLIMYKTTRNFKGEWSTQIAFQIIFWNFLGMYIYLFSTKVIYFFEINFTLQNVNCIINVFLFLIFDLLMTAYYDVISIFQSFKISTRNYKLQNNQIIGYECLLLNWSLKWTPKHRMTDRRLWQFKQFSMIFYILLQMNTI